MKRVMALALALVFALPATSAFADTVTVDNTAVTFIPEDERTLPTSEKIISFDVTYTTGPDELVDARTGRRCRTGGIEVAARNSVGVMYKFGTDARGCRRNGKIVSVDWRTPYGWTAWWTTWSYIQNDTHIEAKGGTIGESSYVWRQWRGHMENCVTWYCPDRYPWIYLGFRADGTVGRNGDAG